TLNASLAAVYKKWRKKNPPDNGYWGHWPMCYDEMPVADELAAKAAAKSDKAVVILGRAAGEDRENTLTPGSFYLTEEERRLLETVSGHFERYAVVMNIGGIMDFSWVEEYRPAALMIVWQGGMEAGSAFADLVSGKTAPSGCLPDTIARTYEDYPSAANFGGKDRNVYAEDIYVGYRYFATFKPQAVLFPFGHGLTYSDFTLACDGFSADGAGAEATFTVRNTGERAGRRTVQLYCAAPQGKLGKPARVLCGYAKTKELAPGEAQTVRLAVPNTAYASFDDSGVTGYKDCFVLEEGRYDFYLGFSSADLKAAGWCGLPETVAAQRCTEAAAPARPFMRFKPLACEGGYKINYDLAPARTADLKARILENLPARITPCVGNGYRFEDVRSGKITMAQFISELTVDELEALSRGDYTMNSPLGPKGNAGVFGGVTQSLREKGVPPVTCTDGPSGIRLATTSALLPNGTCLAACWDGELTADLYACLGGEMKARGSHVLLAPGMNIHRNPLCGRNFEYFSEDPLLTGFSAAAVVRGLQRAGVSACPKH
ncbi:MAG: glycoside hydrolase family 3 C-terminal domain-containing protein, partial [Clostridia bacterium]|nr:glycoside hydrolase family 3 C-terminal domain-containing protein [Clostridia bacterium]